MAFIISEEQKLRDRTIERIKHLCEKIVKQRVGNLTIGDLAWFVSFIQHSNAILQPQETLDQYVSDLEKVLEQASNKGETK